VIGSQSEYVEKSMRRRYVGERKPTKFNRKNDLIKFISLHCVPHDLIKEVQSFTLQLFMVHTSKLASQGPVLCQHEHCTTERFFGFKVTAAIPVMARWHLFPPSILMSYILFLFYNFLNKFLLRQVYELHFE
jgi:hypothetical protein